MMRFYISSASGTPIMVYYIRTFGILGYLFNSSRRLFMGVTMLKKITHGIKISEFLGVAKNNKKFPSFYLGSSV